MTTTDFATSFVVNQSPKDVFKAIQNVRGWWSENIEGKTEKVNDEFTYAYNDIHRCRIKLVEVVPEKKIIWQVLDNYFSFTADKSEWIGTRVVFDITRNGELTELNFTHEGLVPEYECYDACVDGWSQYINNSLKSLITTGKGQPNSREKSYTVHEVALRFNELAQQEKWFEIQDELFAENVSSIEPAHAIYLPNASGKASVRKKGEDWVKRITAVRRSFTSKPVIGGNHFAVGREISITVNGIGDLEVNELMVYEVKEGKIVCEQFFY